MMSDGIKPGMHTAVVGDMAGVSALQIAGPYLACPWGFSAGELCSGGRRYSKAGSGKPQQACPPPYISFLHAHSGLVAPRATGHLG